MSNIKVVYKNELNLIPMRNFSANEMNLFFAICAKMKNKSTETVRFDFSQLKELSSYKATANIRFITDLKRTYQKMLQLTYGQEDGLNSKYFVLFTGFEINSDEQYVEINVNTKLEYILNQLENEFTKWELEEFTKIRSSYSKTMYRLLKQYRNTGFYKVTVPDFRRLLDVPVSYDFRKINQKILTPMQKELSLYFDDLNVKKIKGNKGNKIILLEFYFLEKKTLQVPLNNWLEEQ